MNDLLNAYQMYQKMIRYPHLMGEIRALFLSTLAREGIATAESIEREAMAMLDARKLQATEENVRQYRDGLIDLHFASRFGPEEIENHINLARKNDAFHHLRRVVNTERASSQSIKQVLKEFCAIPQGSMHISSNDAEAVRVALIHHFISDQLPFIGIAKNHITIRDVNDMMDNCVWNRRRGGRIGGKAAGMFLAYRIVLPRLEERDPELERYVAIPESFYFNSGILADFIDYNGFYSFHSQKYKSREVIEEEYGQIAQQIDRASFPADVVEDFRHFLVRIGEHPLILRSSSLLEDNFGHAFSGKYDSVFIANTGDIDTRLAEFIRAYKQVFKSIFSPSAILYRRDHNLLDFDEKMSVLVQKVVGRRFGDYFFPMAAGVAYSRNAYTWTPRIRREDGLVRFVAGLGT
ncbi:MAG: PEP/pyruvate-binding domain-containing protein, partial [Acidobacteriota bacterium]